MLSNGQIIFAVLFVIAFTVITIISYKKDKKLHVKHYKGALWVLVGFLAFVIILTLIKYFIKN